MEIGSSILAIAYFHHLEVAYALGAGAFYGFSDTALHPGYKER